ncbi:hypothetical protein NE683_03610 [Bariatricus massiliensis]|uniref:Uncharacterized protein n=1 Tax=Bariatricus massiliensis TaxID=1745713 RepID=A0ABS8DEL3_9FIRM|nr:hypothetical protein [Bariatricus massiliensis]MCB7303442.1 hypothetical protein [Bariatricus massiliensis]MCB7373574.1 hypothetical protein [Bariatricus massiliensis]MCB7386244.1 hypothetical protein [Bariatricus massiliensis]MCB7410406.1 hypothetical protein [Bariatricus massiliensis]MCQ5252310.1 hypothetical protein [Bariatricus massiliensis]
MIIFLLITAVLVLPVLCCAAMVSTEYDRRIDDEKQEEFLRGCFKSQ